jgi:hypothetical protein
MRFYSHVLDLNLSGEKKMAIIKKNLKISSGKDMKERKPVHTVGGNVN